MAIATRADPQPLPPTFFAPPERATEEEIRAAVAEVAASPVTAALVAAFGSMVAVLDRHRQILAVNDGLLRFLGVADAGSLLGLRPGEALRCVHARDHPAGCGTSRFCTTCGAAIATVLAQESAEPAERECLLTVRDGEQEQAVELAVRAVPLRVDGQDLVLLMLRDIRPDKRRQALEHTFFHDLNNTLTGLTGYAELLVHTDPQRVGPLAEKLEQLALLAAEEVRSHQLLAKADAGEWAVAPRRLRAAQVVESLQRAYASHPVARQRTLVVDPVPPELTLESDPSLVHRVLANMVKNALEATPRGGTVRVSCDGDADTVRFLVWNAGEIPPPVAMRVFQRYFSTKGGTGRGLGTYGMKLIGERHLHGAVGFDTDARRGTTFHLELPRRWARPGRA